MSLAIKYEAVEDARLRLRNTVVLYKGKPVLITDVVAGKKDEDDGPLRVYMQELPTKPGKLYDDPFKRAAAGGRIAPDEKEQRKLISSKHFDIAPFPLGYVNWPAAPGAFYCTRLPNRVQKQGLCSENFSGKFNTGAQVNWATVLTCKETLDMVNNNYPSFDRALAALDKVPSVAFHREFSLMKDEVLPDLVFLFHKGVKVGWYNKDGISLGAKFKCLKESLQEIRVGAR